MLQARDPEEIRKRLWDRVHAWREHAGGRGRIERCDHFFTGMHYSFLNPLAFFTEPPTFKKLICRSSNPDIATVEPRALSGGIVRSVSIKTMRNEGTATLMLHVVGNGNSPTVRARPWRWKSSSGRPSLSSRARGTAKRRARKWKRATGRSACRRSRTSHRFHAGPQAFPATPLFHPARRDRAADTPTSGDSADSPCAHWG